jgi:hypothetical protein
MQRIRNMNDVAVGLLLIAVAVAAFYLSWRLTHGSAGRMGPGYVPRMLIFVQIGLASALIFQGVVGKEDTFERWFPRPLFWVLVGVTFFGVSIERFGLIISVIGLVIISAFAHPKTRLIHSIPLALGLAIFAVSVFVKALGLSILIWPEFLVR